MRCFGLPLAAALLGSQAVTAPELPHSYPSVNGTIVVAPGLPLPNGNLPWALDSAGGRQAIVPIHHATLNEAGPTASAASLPGPRSTNVVHHAFPVLFIHTSERTENTHEQNRPLQRPLWLLLRADNSSGARVIARPTPDQVRSSLGCVPSTICLDAEPMAEGWIRMMPTAALTPGEYVLIPALRPPKSAVEVVYDFTIDPAAPMDRDAILPDTDLTPKKKGHTR